MPVCHHCKTFNNLDNKVCKVCNAVIIKDDGYNCPGCNKEIGPFAKKCRYCGIVITNYYKKTNASIRLSSTKNKVVRQNNNQPDITYLGEVDPFTKETLVENYNILSAKLKVSPKVIVHPRGKNLESYFAGFYHSNGVIEVVDDYLLISCLAHEMRHTYQHQYRPEMYFNTYITNAKQYINCEIERDARKFSMNYCKERGYLEELEYLKEHERNYNLFIKGFYTAAAVNLDDEYFKRNPTYPQKINYEQAIPRRKTHSRYQFSGPYREPKFSIEASTVIGLIMIAFCLYGVYLFITGN